MIIYNDKDEKILEVEVDDTSYRHRVIMGDHNVTLYYSLAEHVELPVGCYCDYQSERFTLMRPEAFKMKHSRNFEYTVTMEGDEAKAKKWMFRCVYSDEGKTNLTDGRLKFSLTAKPHEHLQMFVDNMNRRDSGWAVGECVEGVETCISYDHVYCYEALSQMASEFGTEFEINGKTVSLRKVEYNKSEPLALSYGRGNGFAPNVGRSNYGDTAPTEILYVQGGSDNVDASKYGNSELLLPKTQTLGYDGTHFEDEDGYNADRARHYVTDDKGYSIRRSDKELETLAESSLDCGEVYPKRTGTVTEVIAVNPGKNLYDFCDDTIPETLDYSDCQIGGETMTVIFQDGMLAGKEFEVIYHHNATYNSDGTVYKKARRFEIVPQEIDGQTMPNDKFKPSAVNGNTYIVFHCSLPDAYINAYAKEGDKKEGAEWDLFREGVKYLYDNEDTKFTFTGEMDGIWAKKNWLTVGGKILLGGYVQFTDERFQKEGVLVRITGIKDYINKPFSPTLELSNETVGASFSTTMQELKSAEVLVSDNKREALQFTKRRFRDAKETMAMLEEALLENFTESITPIGVQTMQMLVGDESLQFKLSPDPNFKYDSTTRTLTTEQAVVLTHMTLGITSLSSQHSDSERRNWNVGKYTSPTLTDGTKKFYLYAKLGKSDAGGDFYLSETAMAMDNEDGYYYFLVGVLNSEYEGARSFVTVYGYTEILPSRVTTEKVVSGDGESYFNMAQDAMKLGDALSYNINGDGQLRLRGTLVQSESGTTAPIGCYRGEYNASYTYYNGDEVVYTYNGVTSTYRYTQSTGTSGHAPTEADFWQVVAQGSKGADGTSVNIKGTAYEHLATLSEWVADESKPRVLIDTDGTKYAILESYERVSTPAGMSYEWVEYTATVGDAYLMKSDGSTEDGCMYVATSTGWQNVGKIKGEQGEKGADGARGQFTEYRYATNGSTTQAPDLDRTALEPEGWYIFQPTVVSGTYLWMTSAIKSGDGQTLVSAWSVPIRLSPSDGRGINSVTEYYAASDNCSKSPDITTYTTTAPTLTPTLKYLWNYETVTYSNGETKPTTPSVIGVYGDTGRGISAITEYYLATDKAEDVTRDTAGWTTDVQTVTQDKPYLWNYEKVEYDDSTTHYTAPVIIGHYGRDGEDGTSAAPVFRGAYSSTAVYYGNKDRVDVVKYDSTYYIARTDAPSGSGGFSGYAPTNADYWNAFGASFESVATGLLLAEEAFVENLGVRNLKTAETGKRVHISAETNAMNIYDADNEVAAAFSGDTYTEDDLFTGADQSFTPMDFREIYYSGQSLTPSTLYEDETVCKTFSCGYAGVVSGHCTLTVATRGTCVSATPLWAEVRLYVDGALVKLFEVKGMGNTAGGTRFAVSQAVGKGKHTVRVKVRVSVPNYDSTSGTNIFQVEASAAFMEWRSSAAVRMSRYFANGQAVGCSSDNYVETVIESGKLLHKVKAGSTGIEFRDGALKICLGGVWYTAQRGDGGALILK